jgi:YHS domain-containing protein
MKTKSRKTISFELTAAALLLAAVAFNGCKKSEPQTSTGHEGHDHAMPTKPAEMIDEAKAVVAEVMEQKTCPVMGGAIDKKYFTEYKGQKVYFCCPGCKTMFEENPEKYIAQLPQFKQ